MRKWFVIGGMMSLMLGADVGVTQAAFLLTEGTPFTEDFDGYRGTTDTIPSGWTTAGDLVLYNGSPNDGNAQNGVLTSGSSLYQMDSGWYAVNSTAALADYAFGLRTQTTSTSSLTAAFINDTGHALTGLDIGWELLQFSEGYGNGRISLLWSTDGTTFTSAGLTGGTTQSGVFGASPPIVLDEPAVTALSASLAYALDAGDTVYLRFLWTSIKPGNQPHIAIDNVTVTAVPEVSSLVLAAVAVGSLVAIHRFRNCHDVDR